MRIIFVRHAETTANADGALSTVAPGPSLTRRGVAQASALVGRLADERVTGIYTSPLRRTAETAAPLAEALAIEPIEMPGLGEIEAGDIEGTADQALLSAYGRTVIGWGYGLLDAAIPGGTDGHAFYARFDHEVAAIESAHGPDETVVVFTHEIAIRVWLARRASNVDAPFTAARKLPNGAAVIVEPDHGRWRVLSWDGAAPTNDAPVAPNPGSTPAG